MSKKISSKSAEKSMACTYSPTLYLDFEDVTEVEGLKLDEEITVVVRGRIVSLGSSLDSGEGKKATLALEDFECEILTDQTQFDDLFGDD